MHIVVLYLLNNWSLKVSVRVKSESPRWLHQKIKLLNRAPFFYPYWAFCHFKGEVFCEISMKSSTLLIVSCPPLAWETFTRPGHRLGVPRSSWSSWNPFDQYLRRFILSEYLILHSKTWVQLIRLHQMLGATWQPQLWNGFSASSSPPS